ncbi:50S ribosomal protein L6 [candidate division NPL-UPA2 bacterium]|nr:50S ribosomal protein L6 [candidate division NPL-UPA2 bacterium]
MSRVGKKPIDIPNGVKVTVNRELVNIEGPKGKLTQKVSPLIRVKLSDNQIIVERLRDTRQGRSLHSRGSAASLHGLTRTLIANMVEGVTAGFEKALEIHGVGYRAEVKGKKLILRLRFSHPINFDLPEGVEVDTSRGGQVTQIKVKGIDKQLVGEVAARLRAIYPPDLYKGKGIRYLGEALRRKAGKTAVT